MSNTHRMILMGTGPFAVPSFEALHQSFPQSIVAVVTKASPNLSGKAKAPPTPVLDWALKHQLPIFQPTTINSDEAIAFLKSASADLFVVCDYGQILSNQVLALARLGGVNLHGSLLPRHRGAAPVQWAILAGDSQTGSCVIHMTPKLDGGPILASIATEIASHESAGDLEERLSLLGVQPLLESVRQLLAYPSYEALEGLGTDGLGTRQDSSLATKAPRLSKQDGQLDFRHSLDVIDRQIRGLSPWPGSFGELVLGDGKGMRVSIIKGQPWMPAPSIASDDARLGTLRWGEGLSELQVDPQDKEGLAVRARDGWYRILAIQPAGKRVMEAAEFLRGYQRNATMRFLIPSEMHPLLSKLDPFSHG